MWSMVNCTLASIATEQRQITMLRVLPGAGLSQLGHNFHPSLHSDERPLRKLEQSICCAASGVNSVRCVCDLRVGVTGRNPEATCSASGDLGRGGQGLGLRRCLPEFGLFGDLEDSGAVSLKDVSLAELLVQVGAGEARDAGGLGLGLVQIESNPHPSVLRRYTELEKPFERGRSLPIPMPHKLNRPVPMPLSRRGLLPEAAVRSSIVRRGVKHSSSEKVDTLSYPRLLSKILVVSDDEVRMVLDSWKGRERCKRGAIANLILQLGRWDCAGKALQLFAWVREQPRLWPDDGILLAIVRVALKAGKLTLANKFLVIYGPLSLESALVAVNAYVDQGFIYDAWRILTSLEERGVSVDSELYAKMIVKAGEAGASDIVEDLAAGRYFKLEDCTRVMTVCSKLGLEEEVEAVFQRYLDQDFKPNIVMFTTLMQARARAGKVRQALALFWELEEAGVKPDLIACRVMIRLCEMAGDLNKAVKVYNHMRTTGFVPTSDVFNVMIRLHCREGRLSKAKEVIQEMKMCGCAANSETKKYLSVVGLQ